MVDDNACAFQRPREPDPDLNSPGRLVGTWELSGDVGRRVSYAWMEGDYSE
jgi:hypothetical protein